MMKFIKKMLIKWSLGEIIKIHESQNIFCDSKEYGIDEIVDFADGNIMIGISNEKMKQNAAIIRKEYKTNPDIIE